MNNLVDPPFKEGTILTHMMEGLDCRHIKSEAYFMPPQLANPRDLYKLYIDLMSEVVGSMFNQCPSEGLYIIIR